MVLPIRTIAVLLLAALLALGGCGGRGAPPARPNSVLISIDTLRPDHLGCYGYERRTSPHIDRLAESGIVFEDAMSASCWTLPSHATMLTGLYPSFHGLQDDGEGLPESIPTLAEELRRSGYRTLAAVSHVYVSSTYRLDRGFDRFDDSLIRGGAENPRAAETVDRALALFDGTPEGPFFLFVHFFDPHSDYEPPPPFDTLFVDPSYAGPVDGRIQLLTPFHVRVPALSEADMRRIVDLYDGEIAYVDSEIGRMLGEMEARGLLRNAAILVTADHGEEFREHGSLGHGRTLFGEQLHVPLVLSGTALRGKAPRRSELVSLLDLAPTILALAGAEIPSSMPGVSLLEAAPPAERPAFGESIRYGRELRAARIAARKVIHRAEGDARDYFDLEADPGEKRPLREDPSGGELAGALADYAAVADEGWHLKLIAPRDGEATFEGTIRSDALLVRPMHYHTGNIGPRRKAEFERFETDAGGRSLRFRAVFGSLIGEIAFDTDPPGAPVRFDIRATGAAAGVFLGAGEPARGEIVLSPSDPRVHGRPSDYAAAEPGCYIRAVPPRSIRGEKADLSAEALEKLRALGYVDDGEDAP